MIPFLGSSTLFSLPSNFERNLKTELYMCCKNMELSMTELLNMPVNDRKTYIAIHNKEAKREREEFEKKLKK